MQMALVMTQMVMRHMDLMVRLARGGAADGRAAATVSDGCLHMIMLI